MKKKLLSILLSVCMALSLLPATALADAPTDNWANHADTSWYNSDYADFTISTAAQIAGLASLVNDGKLVQGRTFMLTADIDLSAYGWTPIGTADHPFSGAFVGGGHSITGLTVSATSSSADVYAGLFGNISTSSVSGLSVTGTVSAAATGSNKAYAGLIAGSCVSSTVNSCTANVSAVSATCGSDGQAYAGGIAGNVGGNSSIIYCTVSISGTAASTVYAGGIAGYLSNYSSITNCAVTVDTNGEIAAETGNCTYAGGIAGVSAGTIENCSISGSGAVTATATGSSSKADAGGIAGLSSGSIANCYNTLAVTAANAAGGCVGDNSNGGSVTNCYWLATTDVNNALSCANGGTVTNCGSYGTNGNLTLSGSGSLAASNLLAALNAYVATDTKEASLRYWQVPEGGTYPALCTTWIEALNAKDSSLTITPVNNAATIDDAWDLAWLSKTVSGGAAQTGVTFTQTADIDLSLYDWIPVGYAVYTNVFSGTYDGGSKSITGMNVNLTARGEAFGGLFAKLDGATVKNCRVSGSVRTIATAGGSPSYAGGIAGFSKDSTVTGCTYTGSVSGSGAYGASVGGIVGRIFNNSNGSVSDCTATGAVSAVQTDSGQDGAACAGGVIGYNSNYSSVQNCLHTGKVSADGASTAKAGGVVGDNAGYVYNCAQTGAVTASGNGTRYVGGIVGDNIAYIYNCYAAGAVTGTGNVGGLVGKFSDGDVSNCYFQKTTAINPDLPAAGGTYAPVSCGVFADAGGALTKSGNGELAAANLSDALNAWVSGQKTPADYQTWVVKSGENGGYPVFGDVWKLTLNANDGTQVPATTLHFVAKNAAVGTMPVATGDLLFDSWNTAATGTGTTINTSYTPTADTTLYARWVQPALDVAYGRITGTTSTMQYSLDGGITKTQCKPDSTHTTSVTFSAGNDVRVYANGSEIKLGTVTTAAKTTTAPNITAVTDSSITLDTVKGYEYCFGGSSDITKTMGFTGDGGDFIGDGNAHTITGLNAATQYYIFCRTAGAATVLPSDTVLSAGAVTAYAAPAADAYTLGDNNVLTFDSTKYEVNTAANFTGTAIATGTKLTDKTAYYIRQKARAADGGLYAVPAGTPLVFVCGVRAALSDFSTISGAVDTAITPVAGVTLTLTDATFSNVVANTTTFATNISGITAKVTAVTDTTATLTLSGTPQKKFSGSVRVTIPKTNLTDGQASLTSDLNSGAAANIAGIACEFSDLTLTPANTQASNQNIHLAVKLTANGAPLVGHHIYLQFLGGSLDYKTWWGTTDTDGVADFNPTDIITIPAGTYTVTVKYDGTAVYAAAAPATASYIVTPAVVSGGVSGGSASSTSTTTTTNPDGSTSTTVTDKTTGTVTETTKAKDGGTTVVETKKDGTVTTTETTAAGDKTETVKTADGTVTTTETTKSGDTTSTVKKPDGSMTAAVQQADGTKVVSATAASGTTTASVTVPAGKTGTTVTIPTPAKPSAGTVAVITKADGTKEIVKASVPTGDGLQVTLDESAAVTLVDNAKTFTDVPADSWAKEGVDYVSARETMNGIGGGSFGGELVMTRAMVWSALFRQNADGATDSSSGQWYDNAQKWAEQQKISDGSNPDAAITREQLVTTLYRAAGAPTVSGDLSGFADADQVSAYARSAVLWAVQNGILKGSDGKLDPGANATRNQVAAIFMRSDMSAAN